MITQRQTVRGMTPLDFLSAILGGVSALLAAGSFLWGGVDFGLGVLLGSLVVGLNYFWTKRVLSRVLGNEQARTRLSLIYVFKLGLAGLILYLAIAELGMDATGILVGASSLAIAALLFGAARMAFQPRPADGPPHA